MPMLAVGAAAPSALRPGCRADGGGLGPLGRRPPPPRPPLPQCWQRRRGLPLLARMLGALLCAGPVSVSGQGGFGGAGMGFGGQTPRLGNCPESGPWPGLLQEVERGVQAFQVGRFADAKAILSTAAEAATMDVRSAFGCSLGISSLFRALAFAFCADPQLQGRALRRANQIGLRFLHLAMNWLTHTFVSTGHDQPLIDGSMWPISIQEINDDLTAVANAIRSNGPQGHAPTLAGSVLHHTYSQPKLRIAIVSLCAYPPEHPLPKYSASNQGMYADRHGYAHVLEKEMVDTNRPPAWGKVKLVEKEVRSGDWDWVVWADCDTYFMNMSVTLDSVLYTYAGRPKAGSSELELDPAVHMIVQEDAAMLNSGIFFIRCSDWAINLLQRVWGSDDSPWINHPWWENAAMGWEFLKDNPQKFMDEDLLEFAASGEDDLAGVYPPEVRVAPQTHFNSYHPVTSRFLHDTWEEGKFVIAFNGVLSGSSQAVVNVLYGTYYQTACRLNGVEDRCVAVDPALPWDVGP